MEYIHKPLLYGVSAMLYAGLSIHAWVYSIGNRNMIAKHTAQSSKLMTQIFLVLALLSHGWLLHETIFPLDGMVFGFAYAISVMLWLGVSMYWLETLLLPLSGMGLLLLPSACGAVLLPLVASGSHILTNPASPFFKIHFVIANMAYGMLALAAFHALLMLLLQQRLHGIRHAPGLFWLGRWLDTLPPLMTMEKVLFKQITVGFILLTLTILSGVLFAEILWGRALRVDHKAIFALTSWAMFGALLWGRYRYGWRGRPALRWVLAAFLALVLAYIGSRFVIDILLQRSS